MILIKNFSKGENYGFGNAGGIPPKHRTAPMTSIDDIVKNIYFSTKKCIIVIKL
jgi:hypothetical protein